MKTAIWKFPLEVTGSQKILMPVGSQILSVQFQGEQLCLWALCQPVDSGATKRLKTITIAGTGNPVPDGQMRFIDTVQQKVLGSIGATYVWHIFEVL